MLSVPCYRYMDTINLYLKSINKNTQTVITSVDTILFEEEFLKDVMIYKRENGELLN